MQLTLAIHPLFCNNVNIFEREGREESECQRERERVREKGGEGGGRSEII